jgi:membrane protease YdiL (CAAX protease family)
VSEPPSLRFVVWTAVALLVAYHAAALWAYLTLPSPRVGLFLAGPLFLLAPLLVVFRGETRRSELRLRPVPLAACLAAAAATIAFLPAAVTAAFRLVPPSDELEALLAEVLRADSGRDLALVLLGAAVAPALAEEIFFRGFLQRGLERRIGTWPGILVTATVFGILHGATRAPSIAALGVLFGWIASRSGSVWPSVVAHALTNGIAIVTFHVAAKDGIESEGMPPWTAVLAGLVAGGGFLAAFARSLRLSARSDPSPSGAAPGESRPPA